MNEKPTKAVILARGLGTRMRKGSPGALLSPEQEAAADKGIKALIPIGGVGTGGVPGAATSGAASGSPVASGNASQLSTPRPFLDYVLSGLADAGWTSACLVIGPEHDAVRDYCARLPMRRIRVETAVQEQPLGTADAVAAAEAFVAGESFLCVNSDNYYPREALSAMRELDGLGLAAFDRDGLVAGGNIPAERVRRFGLVEVGEDGRLRRIVEKPSDAEMAAMRGPILVSMNCWRFDSTIFAACRAIGKSPRGELELTDAVQHAIDRMGARFKAIMCTGAVLDLTGRGDVELVARRLAGTNAEL